MVFNINLTFYTVQLYVIICPEHVYTCKFPKITDLLTETNIFMHLFRYVICHFLFNVQVLQYVICFKIILHSNTNMLFF